MRKGILAAGLSIVMAGLLIGCGSKEADSSVGQNSGNGGQVAESAEEDVVLRISWWGNQTRNDGTVAAIQLYESLNPGVKVEYEFSDWSGYWDKLSTQAAGGTMPDIIQHDYAYLYQYVSSNQLASLTPYMEDGTLDLSTVADSILASGSMDGQLYGLCLGTNAPMMIYDKEIVESAGVTIPDQMTIDELYDIGKEIYEATGVKTYYDGGLNMITMMARVEGEEIFDSIRNGNSQYALTHFNNVEKFAQAEWSITPDILAEKDPDVVETKPIVDGSTWNDFSFSNQFIAISNAGGRTFETTLYPMPAGYEVQGMFLKPSMFFTVAETSTIKEEAIKFLDWFTNDEECNKLMMAERGIPIAPEVASAVKEEVDDKSALVFDYIAEAEGVATAIDPPSPSGAGEVEAYLKTVVEKIRYGQLDANGAADEFMAQAFKMLEEAGK